MNKFSKFMAIFFGLIIILLSILSSIVSTGLSIAFFSNLTTDENLTLVVIGFIVLLQIMVLVGSIVKGIVYQRTPQHYFKIVWFTNICFLISVLSTISFFNQFDKIARKDVIKDLLYSIPFLNLNNNTWLVDNLTNMTLIWLSCIVIDLMSMYFPSIGSDLITGISTKQKINLNNNSYLVKIFKLITYYPKSFIDNKCIELGIIEDKNLGQKTEDKNLGHEDRTIKISPETQDKNLGQLKNNLGQENNILTQDKIINNKVVNLSKSLKPLTKNIEPINTNITKKVDISKSPKCIQDVPKQKSEDIGQSEDKIKLRTQDKIKEKTQDMKTGQNKNVSGHIKSEDKIKLRTQDKMNLGLEDLIKNIDEYIVLKYKSGDLIKVGQLKKEFNIKDRLWKDKVINNLSSAKLNENKRLERVQIDNKDKFKIIK
jgi:hypothetical protein